MVDKTKKEIKLLRSPVRGIDKINTGKSLISFDVVYPLDNPQDTLNIITDSLKHLGVFIDLK